MAEFRVSWEIDIDAATPYEAAQKARAIQLDVFSTATVFRVENGQEGAYIDLEEVQDESS